MLAATMYTLHSELGSQGISNPWESYGSVGSVGSLGVFGVLGGSLGVLGVHNGFTRLVESTRPVPFLRPTKSMVQASVFVT